MTVIATTGFVSLLRVLVCLILCEAPSALQQLCATLLQSPAAPVDGNMPVLRVTARTWYIYNMNRKGKNYKIDPLNNNAGKYEGAPPRPLILRESRILGMSLLILLLLVSLGQRFSKSETVALNSDKALGKGAPLV